MALTAESPGFALRNFTESVGWLFLFQPLHVNANYFFKWTAAPQPLTFLPLPSMISMMEQFSNSSAIQKK